MKSTLLKIALALSIAASVGATSAQAYYGQYRPYGSNYHHYGYSGSGFGVYIGTGPSYYGSYYNRTYSRNCVLVAAHWYNGHYYPVRRVCYNGGYYNSSYRCGWINGYSKHGRWIPGHNYCW